MPNEQFSYDVLVIGSGAAGLKLALDCAASSRVAVIAKQALTESNTYYAQGGISVVLDSRDSIESHIQDTLKTGAGLCNENTVRHTVSQARQNIHWLINQGVQFTRNGKENETPDYHLTREGGHSHRRVIHAADATGKAIEETLLSRVQEHSNIDTFEYHMAIDLILSRHYLPEKPGECLGAFVLDIKQNRVHTFLARYTVLATGGAGKVYLYTSNPDIASGDGVAMAWRAGCRIANMEFFQFHPTCLYHPEAKSFLISEAVRGEGAHLLLPDGSRFMERFHPDAELAPRDIVARAIDHEMKRLGAECLYLDISFKPRKFILESFPTIHEKCLGFGIDMTQQPIPIVPASHYLCGGVMTDLHGRTDLGRLYAIGETACTGMHGANRMASNSLLECLVFGESAARDILDALQSHEKTHHPDIHVQDWDDSQVTTAREEIVITHNWDELRRMMWDYVGIVRSTERLQKAVSRIQILKKEISEHYQSYRIHANLMELRNLADVAELIIQSALLRRESRGLHYNIDYPDQDPALSGKPTVLHHA